MRSVLRVPLAVSRTSIKNSISLHRHASASSLGSALSRTTTTPFPSLIKSAISTIPRVENNTSRTSWCKKARGFATRSTPDNSSGDNSGSAEEELSPFHKIITIDRSALYQPHQYDENAVQVKEPETELTKHLKMKIKIRGPLTLAEYIKECLLSPSHGYYTRVRENEADAFGRAGDFTTSPEISQMFGELIGVWCVSMWQQMGRPNNLKIVEFGPGRGTLMYDLLRAASHFKDFSRSVSVHLIEASSMLREKQKQRLGGIVKQKKQEHHSDESIESLVKKLKSGMASANDTNKADQNSATATGTRLDIAEKLSQPVIDVVETPFNGIKVHWHNSFADVEPGPVLVIAQEFYDALPVHQFQFSNGIWRERMVDVDESAQSPYHFQLVLSPSETFAAHTYMKSLGMHSVHPNPSEGDKIEVSPAALGVTQEISKRISEHGGAALIIDYGEDYTMSDTLQGIKNHNFCSYLSEPGMVDLSTYVDFSAVRKVATAIDNVYAYGPTTQRNLLFELGIDARLVALIKNNPSLSEERIKYLFAAHHRLVDEKEMGVRYKALCLFSPPKSLATFGPPFPPVGFYHAQAYQPAVLKPT